jgi:hypothetical protein
LSVTKRCELRERSDGTQTDRRGGSHRLGVATSTTTATASWRCLGTRTVAFVGPLDGRPDSLAVFTGGTGALGTRPLSKVCDRNVWDYTCLAGRAIHLSTCQEDACRPRLWSDGETLHHGSQQPLGVCHGSCGYREPPLHRVRRRERAE